MVELDRLNMSIRDESSANCEQSRYTLKRHDTTSVLFHPLLSKMTSNTAVATRDVFSLAAQFKAKLPLADLNHIGSSLLNALEWAVVANHNNINTAVAM